MLAAPHPESDFHIELGPGLATAGAKVTPESGRGASWVRRQEAGSENLPLVSREWKNGSNSSYSCTPFRHSLLTKGRKKKQ